ncbi:PREDICTED: uncharacterized protein LOC105805006 [Propithecus coquereli]|uniref:uncharacterized protein LOC105805006 n=1 Tax=Propithecus coquereli TaxID=379532 RepID=UPI00063F5D2C|nr:PREDICTED: uncharacterized protein LOC105805006 [Propithecus coquereli]
MPYSVIRGEAFTLKATVLNYLPKCIQVSVQLKASPAFLASQNDKGEVSYCICGNECQTLSWTVTPKTLGNVNFSVSAETVQSLELCRNEVTEVPEIGRKDIVIKTLLVEGIGPQSSSASPVAVVETQGWGLGVQMQCWNLRDSVLSLAVTLEPQEQNLRLRHESPRARTGEEPETGLLSRGSKLEARPSRQQADPTCRAEAGPSRLFFRLGPGTAEFYPLPEDLLKQLPKASQVKACSALVNPCAQIPLY